MPLGRLIDMIDFHGKPFHVDAALRVVTQYGVGYLDGNAHVHRGRFAVWFPDERDSWPTSLDEITSMTDEAACWIAGFLAGNEPDPYEYLGIEDVDAALGLEPTAAELERWREFTAEFRRTGYCPRLNARPISPVPLTDAQRRQIRVEAWVPWSRAGERVWVQRGDVWVEADPQPLAVEDGFAPDSICLERGYHADDVDDLPAEWDVCAECGYVVFHPGAARIEWPPTG